MRKWHFQFVHHPIWNIDMSSAPLLVDVTIDGQAAQGGRARRASRRWLYVFDRDHRPADLADPETPVPQSDVPGEKTSPTQPIPTKPPAYARNYLKMPDDLIDFTPALRAQALGESEADIRTGPRTIRRSSAATPARSARSTSATPAATGSVRRSIPRRTSFMRRRPTRASRAFSVRRRPRDSRTCGYVSGREGSEFR